MHCAGIGATSQLQRSGRRQRLHPAPQLHRDPGRSGSHITTHRASIQLPERAESPTAQAAVSLPQLLAKGSGSQRMALQPATDGQTLQRHSGDGQLRQQGVKGLTPSRSGVHFHRIGAHRRQQLSDRVGAEAVVTLFDQTERTAG